MGGRSPGILKNTSGWWHPANKTPARKPPCAPAARTFFPQLAYVFSWIRFAAGILQSLFEEKQRNG
jgi:hypothetical protein